MMRSSKQEQLKAELHNELKMQYRCFFESKFATAFLQNAHLFASVNKISAAIIKLVVSNKEAVLALITSNPKIINELREPYFGSCYEAKEEPTPEQVLEKIISLLQNEKADLSKIMQVHCLFVYRIYDQLEQKNEKAEWVNKLFPDTLFCKQNRSRLEVKSEDIKLTTQLGITKHPVFSKMLGKSDKNHLRAMEKYEPDYQVSFFKSALEKNIPVVCGPSGHAGSLMLGAKLYGDLTAEQLKEYAWVSFAFLVAGGHHSFHEVMTVAALVGVDFRVGNYTDSIPLSIKETELYQKISRRFPEFLASYILSEDHPALSSLTHTV